MREVGGLEITAQMIDVILYNMQNWRRALMFMEPKTSTSTVKLLTRTGRSGSAVERCAIERASISAVLDVVEDALDRLSPDLQKIARYKYEYYMSYREIARKITQDERKRNPGARGISKSTVGRKVDSVRNFVSTALSLLGAGMVGQFWDSYRSVMS